MSPAIIRNCRLFDAPVDARPVDIAISAGRIESVRPADEKGAEGLEAGGRMALPGLIDVHVHGAGGADMLDGTPEALATISRTLAGLGTTAFLATGVMQPATGNRHLRTAVEAAGRKLGGAVNLGIHIEGPFVNPLRKGALPLESLYGPTPDAVTALLEMTAGALRMLTIAPELQGALPAIERVTAAGVIASFGHSEATYDETRAGFAAGISHVTHVFNAMGPLHHRRPGALTAIFEAEDVAVQVISDGVHVHPAVVALSRRLLGPRVVCITDAMRALGLPEGRYAFGGREFESRAGAARYADGTLIGTAVSQLDVARRFARYTGCSWAEAVATVTSAPARALGLDGRKGSLDPGKDADVVLLDHDGAVWATVVEGELVYQRR